MTERIPPTAHHLPLTRGYASRQAYVRYMATSRPAISMELELRREAASDPGLAWDPRTHRYRRVRKGALRPPLATEHVIAGAGALKLSEATISKPAAAANFPANVVFDPRARARVEE